jgi:hypothetical protein
MTSPLQMACISSPLSPPDTNGNIVIEYLVRRVTSNIHQRQHAICAYMYWTTAKTAQLPQKWALASPSAALSTCLLAEGEAAAAEPSALFLGFGGVAGCLDICERSNAAHVVQKEAAQYEQGVGEEAAAAAAEGGSAGGGGRRREGVQAAAAAAVAGGGGRRRQRLW